MPPSPTPSTLLAVLSDTHGHVPLTQAAVHLLRGFDVAAVLHCGDIGSPAIVRLLAEWPVHYVFGNVDDRPHELRAAITEAGQTCHERFGELTLVDQRIAFLHGDDAPRFQESVASQRYDLVCYGHTHRAEQHLEGRTRVLNPGAIYRANPHTLAIVELPTLAIHIIRV